MSTNLSMEVYNDLQQFKEFFHSISDADREEPAEVFDLESFLDESWLTEPVSSTSYPMP